MIILAMPLRAQAAIFRWRVDLFAVRALVQSRWLSLQDTKPPWRRYS